MAFLNETGLERLWTHIVAKLGTKVDKVSGKGLSTNDYTDEDKEKLNSAAVIHVGPDEPTDPNVKVWINTSEDSGAVALLPRIATITLAANSWTGDANPWAQSITISGVTVNTKVDLQPTAAQIVALQDAEISLMVENNDGALTCYAIGNKPTTDYTMQVFLQEVALI